MFETLSKFMQVVNDTVYNQKEIVQPILDKAFNTSLSVYESALANVTECVLTRKSKKTAAVAAVAGVVAAADATINLQNNKKNKKNKKF